MKEGKSFYIRSHSVIPPGVSMASYDPLITLVEAKSRALLHDPPNKMWVLRRHEEVAGDFRRRVLEGTLLAGALMEDHRKVVERADRMASAFDRWLINAIYTRSASSVIVEYNRLHNILRPDASLRLEDVPQDKAYEVVEEVGGVLRKISQSLQGMGSGSTVDYSKMLLLYSTLYFLLEVAWYSKGLHPSLADTRAPTHTVFDHLYATTSIVNQSLYDKPTGFIVRVDIPGVQSFISSSRKTSDFWAGSWILSQLMWGVVEELVDGYGPDIVLTPTLRLNPYFFKYIVEKLEENMVDDSVITSICKHYIKLLSGLGWDDLVKEKLEVKTAEEACERGKREKLLEMLTLTPLIPATVYLILPPLIMGREHVEDMQVKEVIRDRVYKAYRSSWTKLLKKVKEELKKQVNQATEDSKRLEKRILLELLDFTGGVLEHPHIGIRVDMMDVREVYEELLKCLEGHNKDYCRGVGLSLDDANRLVEVASNKGIEVKALANNLLWHVIMTHVLPEEIGRSPIPIPRPFWELADEVLNPVGDYTKLTKAREGDWSTCSLCGDEPAVIHPVKVWNKKGVESFDEEWLRKLEGFLKERGVEVTNSKLEEKLKKEGEKLKKLEESLREIMRPGESLGPYCLFKRIAGKVYSNLLGKYYGLVSTDDIALKVLSDVLTKDNARSKRLEELQEVLGCKFLIFIVPQLYKEKEETLMARDLDKASRMCELAYEEFINRVSRLLKERFCSDIRDCLNIVSEMFPEFSNDIIRLSEMTPRLGEARNFLGLRTRYSIVKGDGDSIGMVLTGVLKPVDLTIDGYTKKLLESVSKNLSEPERSELDRVYRIATEISEIVTSGKGIPVSPALTTTISLALQVTALRDVASIIGGSGFPVYSGGDDVLALLPLERVFPVVETLRSHFWGDDISLFHRARINGVNVVISQAIPTGRSFSVRVADIKDIMSHEVLETLRLLEGEAKNAKWREVYETDKDSIVVSDSRSRARIVLPLSLGCGDRRLLSVRGMLKALSIEFLAENMGVLSPSTPEDLDRVLSDPVTGEKVKLGEEPLLVISKRVLKRNVSVKSGVGVKAEDFINMIVDSIGGRDVLKLENKNTGRRLLEELVEFIRVLSL